MMLDEEKELEKTKEFVPMDNKENEPISDDYSKEEASLEKLVESMEKEEQKKEEQEKEERLERKEEDKEDTVPLEPNPGKKKKVFVFLVIAIFMVIVAVVVVLFLLLSKPDKKEEIPDEEPESVVEESNQEIFDSYVTKLQELINGYVSSNTTLPTYEELSSYVKLDSHTITCEQNILYPSGNLYLSQCSVDQSEEKFFYGEEEKKQVTGKVLTIYHIKKDNSEYYGFEAEKDSTSTKVGEITCAGESCTGYDAFLNYAIIEEEGKISVYDYQKNQVVFGPTVMSGEYEALASDTTLYGIYWQENKNNFIYSLVAKKKISNIEGEYLYDEPYKNVYLAQELGYTCFSSKGKTNVFDVKTGKLAFTVPGEIVSFYREGDSLYEAILSSGEYIKIYDQNGKSLFQGEELDSFFVNKKNFVTTRDGVFKVYDRNNKLQYTSEKQEKIGIVIDDYVVVMNQQKLQLLDYKGNLVHTFIDNWDEDSMVFHTMLSGWYEDHGKNGVYLVIQDSKVTKEEVKKENPDMSLEDLKEYDLGYEYYYIPTTKESGKIPTYIGGYAKPVLYLYPTLPTFVNVTFRYPERLTTTYPKYQNKWSVLATPNGTLLDQKQKSYYALYWEEKGNHYVDFKEGFYVTSENAIDFLEEKLSLIGLNDHEKNEFIMYWLPILEKNGQSLVYFELTEERNAYSPIEISLRMAIHIKKVDSYQKIKQQRLTSFQRKGFTAVEWGGVIY